MVAAALEALSQRLAGSSPAQTNSWCFSDHYAPCFLISAMHKELVTSRICSPVPGTELLCPIVGADMMALSGQQRNTVIVWYLWVSGSVVPA